MRRALADLALGARLAATGGADSRLRAALTALGVAFGVALLLFAASVPNMVSAHNARVDAQISRSSGGHARLIEYGADTTFRGESVTVSALQRTGPNPPLPPGINQIPAPGQMLVSPALARLLRSPAGAELSSRLRCQGGRDDRRQRPDRASRSGRISRRYGTASPWWSRGHRLRHAAEPSSDTAHSSRSW